MQLTPLQSMGSGFSAACLGPVATGPFDVIKVRTLLCCLGVPIEMRLKMQGTTEATVLSTSLPSRCRC